MRSLGDVEGHTATMGGCACSTASRRSIWESDGLRRIAIHKFRVPPADAETIVQDVFTTYLMQMSSVRAVGPYLIGAICNASRYYWRRTDAADAVFCGDVPCRATPDDTLAETIERKLTLSRILKRVDCRFREFLQRYYIRGETMDVIAAAMG